MAGLFERGSVGGLEVRNRLVRSATCEWMCDGNGRSGQDSTDLYAELARGGVGLIIASHTFIQRDGRASPGQLGIYTDELGEAMRQIADVVHAEGEDCGANHPCRGDGAARAEWRRGAHGSVRGADGEGQEATSRFDGRPDSRAGPLLWTGGASGQGRRIRRRAIAWRSRLLDLRVFVAVYQSTRRPLGRKLREAALFSEGGVRGSEGTGWAEFSPND